MNADQVVESLNLRLLFLTISFLLVFPVAHGQQKTIDGKEFFTYKASSFKPKRGLFYTLYLAPTYTVDPLGLGGKSTFALSAGTRINIWESKTENLQGLKIEGWYLGGGYEYYPQQFDMAYVSAWVRVHTFIPFAGKIDLIYAFDGVASGMMSRFCIGIEAWKLTLFVCGSISYAGDDLEHPVYNSDYTTAGTLQLIIPVYTRD